MKSAFRIFFYAPDTKPLMVLVCLLIAGASQVISLGALLPVVTKISGGESSNSSSLNHYINEFLSIFGLPATLGVLIVLVVTAMVLKNLMSFAAMSYAAAALARVTSGFQTTLLKGLFSARWSYFVSHRTGHISALIAQDCTRAGNAYFASARLFAYAIQAIASFIVALLISLKLALAGAIVGAIMVFVLKMLVSASRRAGNKQAGRIRKLTTYVADALGNIKPIRTMDRQTPFENYFHARIEGLRRALFQRQLARQGLLHAQETLQAVVAGIGIYAAATYWKIPLPELVVSGIIFVQLISVFSKMQGFLQQVAELEGSYNQVQTEIKKSLNAAEIDSGTKIPALISGCYFKNVSFMHDKSPVIVNANLTIPAGGITVLQGPSGSGKTTLIDLLIGLHQPDQGQILIDDVPLPEISLHAWRQKIGYVPQELTLLHGSIRQNITLGDADVSDNDIERALNLAEARDFISAMPEGLETDVGEMGRKLSGGQRQRIALARALLMNPQILVLDEVTSALDPETETDICRMIAKLAGQYTILAITHRPAWMEIATDLYKVEAGKISKVKAKAKTQG